MLNNIAIITTTRCDLKCRHCLRGFPEERPDFPIELLDKLLTEALPFGAHHIGLTGGELYLHPQFDRIVEKIVAYGFTWHFVTNGQNPKPYLQIMERYKDTFGYLSLSIDGAVAATHDELRNKKGAFNQAVASAKEYIQEGYKVKIASTLHRKNKDEMEAMLNLAVELGAKGIGFGGIIPTPWNQDLVLSDEESIQLWEKANGLREKTGFEIRTVSALHTRGGVNFCNNLNLRELTFNSRGELMFCCDTINHGAVIGSLYEESISELMQKWLEKSCKLQKQRAKHITNGELGQNYDTCAFCNDYLDG
jgi:MoaA/NifB/PqqE/SkfB family radical SAM enzyme